jgi:hypothetical protein
VFLATEHPVKEKLCMKEGLEMFPGGMIHREQSASALLGLEWGHHIGS